MRHVLVVLLFSLSLFAGCLGGGGDEVNGENGSDQSGPRGTIEGTVVDMDFMPIPDATVNVINATDSGLVRETRTDGQGAYNLRVAPGTYRLQVSAVCCHQDVRVIVVIEGETLQEVFRLERFGELELRTPYHEGFFEWAGFISHWISPTLPGQNGYFGGDPEHRQFVNYRVDPGVKTVTAGLRWTPAGGAAAGDELCLFVMNGVSPPLTYERECGTSPIEIRVDAADVEETSRPWSEQNATSLRFYVEPPSSQVTNPEHIGVTYQQDFRIFWTVHYWDPAPDTYSTVPDQ